MREVPLFSPRPMREHAPRLVRRVWLTCDTITGPRLSGNYFVTISLTATPLSRAIDDGLWMRDAAREIQTPLADMLQVVHMYSRGDRRRLSRRRGGARARIQRGHPAAGRREGDSGLAELGTPRQAVVEVESRAGRLDRTGRTTETCAIGIPCARSRPTLAPDAPAAVYQTGMSEHRGENTNTGPPEPLVAVTTTLQRGRARADRAQRSTSTQAYCRRDSISRSMAP